MRPLPKLSPRTREKNLPRSCEAGELVSRLLGLPAQSSAKGREAEAGPVCARSRHPFARGNCWEEIARPCGTSHVARLKGGLVCGNGAVQSA